MGGHEIAEPVLARAVDGIGYLTLNRPATINALNYQMLAELAALLAVWRTDSNVDLIVLAGAGERGLCAGGDVRLLRDYVLSGKTALAERFFRAEYALNATIAEYPKPIVVIMDGITMGGGIGLGGHAAIRVVTERSRLAMPETRIGFIPDTGGSWLLGRAPGRLGEYLALTGETMTAADAIYAGFADYYLPSERIPEYVQALAERADPSTPAEITLLFDETPEPGNLARQRDWIDQAFSGDTVADIIVRLLGQEREESHYAAEALERSSPTALTLTLEAARRARRLPGLRAALVQEYALACWSAGTQPDFVEGIRARLVDKSAVPRWQPATLAELDEALIATAFSYRPDEMLWAPQSQSGRRRRTGRRKETHAHAHGSLQ